MTIHIEELESIGFSNIAEDETLPLIHPGKILREEFLIPLNITPMRSHSHCKSRPLVSTILCESAVPSPPTLRLD